MHVRTHARTQIKTPWDHSVVRCSLVTTRETCKKTPDSSSWEKHVQLAYNMQKNIYYRQIDNSCCLSLYAHAQTHARASLSPQSKLNLSLSLSHTRTHTRCPHRANSISLALSCSRTLALSMEHLHTNTHTHTHAASHSSPVHLFHLSLSIFCDGVRGQRKIFLACPLSFRLKIH